MSAVNVNIDGDAVKETSNIIMTLINWCKKVYLSIPQWLRILLLASIIGGGSYFYYTKTSSIEEIQILQEQVLELNKKVQSHVYEEDYKDDLEYLITSLRIMEQMEMFNYREHQHTLEVVEKFVKRNHPNDNVLREIEEMKIRSTFEYQTMMNHFDRMIEKEEQKFDTVATNVIK